MTEKKEDGDRRASFTPVTPIRIPSDPQAALTREAGSHVTKTIAAAYGTMMWDNFAGHALQGILAHGCPDLDEAAKSAALAADAMMEERQRRVEKGHLRDRKKRRNRAD